MKRAIIRTALLLLIGIQATDVFAGQYIVKRKYLVAPPNGKLPPPISKDDVVRAGGKVDFDLFDRLVITIPDAAVQAIRKHGSVKYLQRVLVGEQVPVFPTDTLQASQLTPAADISPPS